MSVSVSIVVFVFVFGVVFCDRFRIQFPFRFGVSTFFSGSDEGNDGSQERERAGWGGDTGTRGKEIGREQGRRVRGLSNHV